MKLLKQTPKKALKAFLKQRPLRSEIDVFKTNLITLLDKISVIENRPKDESEEHLKNDLRDFLRDTYYKDTNAINTKDKKDLVIHLGKTTDSEVGVIIEAKRPTNINEMVSGDNPNKKALHELILYYLDERNKVGNNQLKQLVITNVNEWYIIDVNHFDKHINRNKQINKLYETKINDKKDNPFFYEEVAKIIEKIDVEIPCVYFDIREYDTILRNNKKEDDRELTALQKILSPQHLLKIVTPNDSNSLDERFYKELLHIIGLEEAKEGGKNIIMRKLENKNPASLIESTIDAILTEDSLHRLPDQTIYGEAEEERIFNISLELCITWINRILFLKLLEGQLVTYHPGNKEKYLFLNSAIINDFDELFKLFHKVLAVNLKDRTEAIIGKFSQVPYLNSSLFEISELEDQTIKLNSLDNDGQLELINTTILKDIKKKADRLPTLEYLFKFLNAYNFASEGTEDVQEDNKTIINASVLGKVFEKINGYKDGSIFTPGFITMHMCRQAIRLAVVEKFNEALSKNGKNLFDKFEDVKNYTRRLYKTQDILRANEIINSLRICDPAVGSGHYLVSSLNEIICIKAELGILADEHGNSISGYEIEIINDELIITDPKGNSVEYKLQNGKPVSKEMQHLQKTLFHEKQTLIENCLFGVDINPNSVKICRLRLWIELLKNAYYKEETDFLELETLPNIDINIKCGNSLLSRFPLDADLSKALKSIKYDIKAYRGFVNEYKNEKNREVKRGLQIIIDTIKSDFRTNLDDPFKLKISKARGEVLNVMSDLNRKQQWGEKIPKELKDRLDKASKKLVKLEAEKEAIINNAIYKNAFEWRFEFPEVLNNNGDFEGFDLIIGNPPYIKEDANRDAFNGLRTKECYQGKMDIWYLFGDLGLKLLKPNYNLCYIATNNWVTNAGASNFRNIVIKNNQIINLTDFGAYMIFENASIQTMIMLFKNNQEADNYAFDYRKLEGEKLSQENVLNLLTGLETENTILLFPKISKEILLNKPLTFNTDRNSELLDKIKAKHNFFLREKANRDLELQAEVGSGIDVLQDFVSKANCEKLIGKAKVGDGVFVLSQIEFDNMRFSKKEKEIIKPYYTTEQLQKYSGHPENQYWILYTKSDIGKLDKETKKIPINDYPKIKEHLDKFRSIITSDNKPYGLHRTREQHLFEGEKIFALRKCPNEPRFTYTDFDCYVSRAFLVVQSNRINLKYLTGLLNSKLIAFWLHKKGKMQGNAYQLDKEPLLEIPIYKPTDSEANKIATLVDKITAQKQQGIDSTENEREIDELVYNLYDITSEEQKIIEGN
ncbi:MAG: Eco57I restriction-modification methylase domain-containing protein [Bacteroidetes bacterium]|nr:Eco57I restriction-modification methylase domain-containing protein [Bacteroidota bacterium]